MIDVVMITTGARLGLLEQSLDSLYANAEHFNRVRLTVVIDGSTYYQECSANVNLRLSATAIVNFVNQGASAARNIGAGSIPKYRRQKHVLFLDDDVYMCPKWDERLIWLAEHCDTAPHTIISGYCHPYNRMTQSTGDCDYGIPLVISSVAMMMPWSIWDEVGPWDEPGGPGGSEDYALCMRAKDKGFGFAVTEPQCVIHAGMTSSRGEFIVGYNELAAQNDKLLDLYGVKGKVVFS